MPISWNEIKARALAFSRDWADVSSESAEAKTFWNEFFHVFGISRRRVAAFETRVKKIDGRDGYIDLLWKGVRMMRGTAIRCAFFFTNSITQGEYRLGLLV